MFKRKRNAGQFQRATRPRTADKRPKIQRKNLSWLRKKANAAHPEVMPEAMYELYRRTGDDTWLVKLTSLARCFAEGKGVEQNWTKAVEWYTKAAEKGHGDAMYNIGVCFEKGEGVEQNWTKAVEWYTKAAEKGHSSAMSNLGRCFEKGEGVEQNLAKAVEWYTKAVDHGRAKAKAYLERARRMMQNNDQ